MQQKLLSNILGSALLRWIVETATAVHTMSVKDSTGGTVEYAQSGDNVAGQSISQ